MKEYPQFRAMIDSHVHLRFPGGEHKEGCRTGTEAALAGGVGVVLDMPNTNPPIVDAAGVAIKREIAAQAYCDWGIYLGATAGGTKEYGAETLAQVVGLKMFLNPTTGNLHLTEFKDIRDYLIHWPLNKPLMVHAEEEKVFELIDILYQLGERGILRPVHFAHISLAKEVDRIREAKEQGLPITCEVTPHHLFLTEDDERHLGAFGRMKPPLRTQKDVDALWKAIDLGIIDTIGSDHAPHTRGEKLSKEPPFGVPGLETTLPLLLTAYVEGKLSLEQINRLTWENPQKIFKIQPRGWQVEAELDWTNTYGWQIKEEELQTRCGWSPFRDRHIRARIRRVLLDNQTVFENGKVNILPGFGQAVILHQA